MAERVLPNGATVIKEHHGAQFGIVLARTVEGQPYATWEIRPDDMTYWGHYFDSLEEAESDFTRRCRTV